MTVKLRDYQIQAKRGAFKAWSSGHQFILGHMATGGGKTITGGKIVADALNGGRAVWLAHTKELVSQPIKTFTEHFFAPEDVGRMQGRTKEFYKKVTCGTFQTFVRQVDKFLRILTEQNQSVDILVIDEGHRALSKSYLKIIEKIKKHSPNFKGLLLTATPKRGDGDDLRKVYSKKAFSVPMGMLIAMGYLVPPSGFALKLDIDFSQIRTSGKGVERDYVSEAVSELLDFDNVHEVVYKKWRELAYGRSTIIFTGTVNHAIHMAEYFSQQGEYTAVVSGESERTGIYRGGVFERADRKWIISELKNGNIKIVCNCIVFTEGFDAPILSCMVNMRPTRNQGLYIQMVGRILRTFNGKHDAIIIDACPNDARSLVQFDDIHERPKEERFAIKKAQDEGVIIDLLPLEDSGFGIDIDPDQVVVQALNLLSSSKYAWTWQNDLAVCPVGDTQVFCVAVLRDAKDFCIYAISKDTEATFINCVSCQKTALTYAEMYAEAAADSNRKQKFMSKNAGFRNSRPSQRELAFMKKYGIDSVKDSGTFSKFMFHTIAREAINELQ